MLDRLELFLQLAASDVISLVAIYTAIEILWPKERSITMNEQLQQQLKRFDHNGDGKVSIADARYVLERELAKRNPLIVAIAAFASGVLACLFVR